jgi:hypothetical protein
MGKCEVSVDNKVRTALMSDVCESMNCLRRASDDEGTRAEEAYAEPCASSRVAIPGVRCHARASLVVNGDATRQDAEAGVLYAHAAALSSYLS